MSDFELVIEEKNYFKACELIEKYESHAPEIPEGASEGTRLYIEAEYRYDLIQARKKAVKSKIGILEYMMHAMEVRTELLKDYLSECEIVIPGRTFVFTGLKERPESPDVIAKLEEHGGIHRSQVSGKTDYLVVFLPIGNVKLEDALELRKHGHDIKIIVLEDLLPLIGLPVTDYKQEHARLKDEYKELNKKMRAEKAIMDQNWDAYISEDEEDEDCEVDSMGKYADAYLMVESPMGYYYFKKRINDDGEPQFAVNSVKGVDDDGEDTIAGKKIELIGLTIDRILEECPNLDGLAAQNSDIPSAKPLVGQHRHLDFLNTTKGGLFSVNASGMEYELLQISEICDDDAFNEIADTPIAEFDLAETAHYMAKLFFVDPDVFDKKHDRVQEILQGYIQSAALYNKFRSFAWTFAAFCDKEKIDPASVDFDTIQEIVEFIESRDGLNYTADSFSPTLCSGDDLLVYYIPDSVPDKTKKELLKLTNEELLILANKDVDSDMVQVPEVRSLDGLRKELDYMYPAIRAIYDEFEANRDIDEALIDGVSDILYVWCSMTYAARGPFYTDDGPSRCWFEHPYLSEAYWATVEESDEKHLRPVERPETAAKEERPEIFTYEKGIVASGDGYTLELPDNFVVKAGENERDFIAYIPNEEEPENYLSSRFIIYAGLKQENEDIGQFRKAEEFSAISQRTLESIGANCAIFKKFWVTKYLRDDLPGAIAFGYYPGCLHANALLGVNEHFQMMHVQIAGVKRKRDKCEEIVNELFDHMKADKSDYEKVLKESTENRRKESTERQVQTKNAEPNIKEVAREAAVEPVSDRIDRYLQEPLKKVRGYQYLISLPQDISIDTEGFKTDFCAYADDGVKAQSVFYFTSHGRLLIPNIDERGIAEAYVAEAHRLMCQKYEGYFILEDFLSDDCPGSLGVSEIKHDNDDLTDCRFCSFRAVGNNMQEHSLVIRDVPQDKLHECRKIAHNIFGSIITENSVPMFEKPDADRFADMLLTDQNISDWLKLIHNYTKSFRFIRNEDVVFGSNRSDIKDMGTDTSTRVSGQNLINSAERALANAEIIYTLKRAQYPGNSLIKDMETAIVNCANAVIGKVLSGGKTVKVESEYISAIKDRVNQNVEEVIDFLVANMSGDENEKLREAFLKAKNEYPQKVAQKEEEEKRILEMISRQYDNELTNLIKKVNRINTESIINEYKNLHNMRNELSRLTSVSKQLEEECIQLGAIHFIKKRKIERKWYEAETAKEKYEEKVVLAEYTTVQNIAGMKANHDLLMSEFNRILDKFSSQYSNIDKSAIRDIMVAVVKAKYETNNLLKQSNACTNDIVSVLENTKCACCTKDELINLAKSRNSVISENELLEAVHKLSEADIVVCQSVGAETYYVLSVAF